MKKLLILAILGLAGCATSKAQTGMAIYDFGALRLTAESAFSGETRPKRLGTSLLVTDVAAPTWLDSNAIQYRLAYHDPARIYAYGANRWAASPSILLTQRIRNRIAAANDGGVASAGEGVRTDYVLRVELQEFTQIFDTPDQSRAVVTFRASLTDPRTRALISQQNFNVEQSAPAADAPGAVRALTDASDKAIGELIAWLMEELVEEKKDVPTQNDILGNNRRVLLLSSS
jgi:cholesterol transport system auxiliary component